MAGQSNARNYMHLIFGTKNRFPFINPTIENELYAYMGGICKALECKPIKIGGHKDHVHVLCILSKKYPLIKLVEEIKAHSSKWIKTKGSEFGNFYWQDGYAALSVGPEQVDRLIAYIENQHEHHKSQTFIEEIILFLNKYEIEFDEKYL